MGYNSYESHYSQLFTSMEEGVAIYKAIDNGEDFVFIDFNPAAEKIEKISKKEVIGKPVTQVFPNVIEFGLLEVFRRVWKTGKPEDHPITLYQDGRIQGYRENHVYKLQTGEVIAVYNDATERKQNEEHLLYIYQVLLAIRNVNQLIVTEKDRDTLLQNICNLMVETKGYNHCRIMSLDQSGEIDRIFDTSSNHSNDDTKYNKEDYPCIDKLTTDKVTIFSDPSHSCEGCPLYSGATGYTVIGMTMSYNDNLYGYCTAAVPKDMTNPEELSLFEEVVEDISYALYNLDTEKEKEKAIESLIESENRYKSLFTNIIGAYAYHKIVYDANGKAVDYIFLEVNDEFEKTTGLSKEEIIGKKVTQVLPNIVNDQVDWIGVYGNIASRGESTEFENYSEVFNQWFHIRAYGLDEDFFVTIFTDITERKRAEEILLAEARLFSTLIDPDKDIEAITSEILEEVKKLTRSEHGYVSAIDQKSGDNVGYTLTNMMEKCNVAEFQARFPVNSDGTYNGLWGHTLNTKKSYFINKYQSYKNKTGIPQGHIQIENFLSVPVLHGEKLVGQISLANSKRAYIKNDVQAIERIANIYALALRRMEYEESIKTSQDRLSGFIDSAVDGFSLLDQNMRYIMVNDAELRYSGKKREDYIGKHILDVIPNLKETGRYDGYLRVLETGQPVEYKRAAYLPENEIWFDFSAFKAGDILGIISKNVTDQVKFEQRLEALHQYAIISLEADSLEKLTDSTIKALQEILEFEFCDVTQVNEDKTRLLKSSRPGNLLEMPLDGPGIVIRAVNEGKTQYVPDIRLDPDYVAGGKRDETGKIYDILSELAVPVKVKGKVRLALNIERSKVDAFSEQDQRLVEILATHTASAYELIQERERRTAYTNKLESLYRITESLPAFSTIDEIAAKIELAVREIIGFDLGSFGLVRGNILHHKYIWGVELNEEFILSIDGKGVTTRAVRTGETQLVRDTLLEEDHVNPKESGVTRSELCVPVKIKGKVVAVINIESRIVNAFSDEENSLLSILAEHVGSTMYNIQLRDHEREFAKRLELLSNSMTSMNTAETIDELASDTLEIIDEIIKVPFSSFSMVENDCLVYIKSKGAPLLDLQFPLDGSGITVRAVRENKSLLVSDTRLDPSFVKGSTDSLSELAIPLVIDGKPVGVINMESLELGYFDSTHQSLAETLAANVASNLQRLYREEATKEAERRAIREQERAEQAIHLEEMKTSFIRTATHEIRTPLTSIKGYAQLAQTKIDQNTMPELDRYLGIILRNTERLEALSADLIDMQRIESGRIELHKTPVKIREIINDVLLEITPVLDARKQKLTVSGEDYIIDADKIRIMQVFINLVQNASKYSPEGKEIQIVIEKDGNKAKISVIDEGVGIDKDDIPKLFKPFPSIRVKGVKDSTGLGLSIARGLIELHGGEIWVESEGRGKGSRFTFTCPCHVGV